MKTHWKRFLSVLMTVALLLNAVALMASAADAMTIQVSTVTAAPGETVQVQITLADNPGISSLKLKVAYGDVLTLTNVEFDSAFGAYATAPQPYANPQTLSCISPMADITVNGTFATLTFSVAEDAEDGTFADVELSYDADDIFNGSYEPVAVRIVNGKVAVSLGVPGDISGDDKVNNKDCVLLFRYIAGWNEEVEYLALDVNGDNKINNKDAIDLFRYCAGWQMTPTPYAVFPAPWHAVCAHNLEAIERGEPTCTEDGNIAYWHCTICSKYYENENAVTAISLADTVLPAIGHSWQIIPAVAATSTSEGSTEGRQCTVCGVYDPEPEVIPQLQAEQYAITYYLYDNKEYLETVGVNNPNEAFYTSEEGRELDDASAAGYIFDGWFTPAGDRVTEISKGETGSKRLYARWTVKPYEIQFDSPLVDVENATYTVATGAVLPSPKLSGYSFVGWSDDDGNIIKRIPVGTTGDKIYVANWVSDRNQARTKKAIEAPIILETDNKILFTYEIGEIRNVPVSVIHDFGKIVDGGIGMENSVTHSKTVSVTEVENYDETVAKATTENYGITLSNGWQDGYSISEDWCQEHGMTTEEAQQYCTNESSNWYVSTGKSGSSTTTTFNTTDTTAMQTGTYNTTDQTGLDIERSATSSHTEESHKDFSFNESISASGKIGPVKVGGQFEANQSFGSSESDTTTNSAKTSLNTSATVSNGGSAEAGTVTHTGSNTTSTGSWNSESGRGGSTSVTQTDSVRKQLTEAISQRTGYGKSYITTGNESTNQGFSSNESSSVSYSSGVTYSTAETEEITEKISTTNTKEGYHRWVWATTAHVFLVVGYDIATSSYFVCNYSILEDEVHRFEDYSYDTASYDDNQTGVITFEVPTDIKDYVMDKTAGSEGLQYSRDGKVTGYTGSDDFVIIPEYKVINGTVIKVTGIAANAFGKEMVTLPISENELLGIELSDYITEIPAGAFQNCSSLKYINFKNVTSIGDRAFAGCVGLKVAKISDNVTYLGENAFENLDGILAYAGSEAVAEAVVASGAKAIALVISEKCDYFDNVTFTVPEGTEFFGFYGGESVPKTFIDVSIVSNADETLILNANFESTRKTPIQIASSEVLWGESNVTAPHFGVIFTADQTNLAIYGESTISSMRGNAILTKSLSLTNINDELYSQFYSNGNVLACGTVERNGFLTFTSGEVVPISVSEYLKYLGGAYTITFDVNADDGIIDETERVAYFGTQTEAFPEPTRTYYLFDGWYSEAEEGEQITPESLVTRSEDITLYAHWTPDTYVLTLNPNGGTVSDGTLTKVCGQTIGNLPNPTRSHYSFNGWFTDAANGTRVTENSVFYADTAIFAHWQLVPYTATWSNGTGYTITVQRTSSPNANASIGTINSGTTVYYGDVLTVTYKASTGYNIKTKGSTSVTVSGNVTSSTIYATAEKIVVNVPNFNGWSYSNARSWLQERGINVNLSHAYNYDYASGTVYSQSASGNMTYGSTVTLYYSDGAKPYAVGDYVVYAGNAYLYASVPSSGGQWKPEACGGWLTGITWYNGVQYLQFSYNGTTAYGWASADHFYQQTN